MDSIHYARLIQDSILPSRADLDASLAGHFEIVRPRDPVGGDFFFFRAMADGFCLAVADCTGHGVPGAFMTMMVKAHLDRIVEAEGATAPSDMIRELDRLVRESLKGEAAVAHLENGLDIALCRYRASSFSLEFSGGGLPLFLWKDGSLTEVPGDRAHLGFSGTRRGRTWTDRIIEVSGGARVYLVSDGVLDLPGGKNGLPFGRARLRSLIEKIAPLPFGQTEAAVTAALDDYRGSRSQRDDLTFIGFGIRGREA
jgi:phosphoserine phosphatase RsbU/P